LVLQETKPTPGCATWREMNLSETPSEPHTAATNLRWATPAVEVDRAATRPWRDAHVLWRTNNFRKGSRLDFLHSERSVAGGPPRRLDRAGLFGKDCGRGRRSAQICCAALESKRGHFSSGERLRLPGGRRVGGNAASLTTDIFTLADSRARCVLIVTAKSSTPAFDLSRASSRPARIDEDR